MANPPRTVIQCQGHGRAPADRCSHALPQVTAQMAAAIRGGSAVGLPPVAEPGGRCDRGALLLGFGLAAGLLLGLEPGNRGGVAALAFLGGNGFARPVVEGPDPDVIGAGT